MSLKVYLTINSIYRDNEIISEYFPKAYVIKAGITNNRILINRISYFKAYLALDKIYAHFC